ncbi:MAG: hypothetical protein ACOYYI_13600, partial [Chloroflexota bacterium]
MPESWKDFRIIHSDFLHLGQKNAGEWVVVRGIVKDHPDIRFNGKAPRTIVRLVDKALNRIGLTFFGDSRQSHHHFKPGNVLCVAGKVGFYNNAVWLNEPELVMPYWQGKLCPVYPSKTRVINADTVRDRVLDHLDDAIPAAAEWIAGSALESARAIGVAIEPDTTKIAALLRSAH